MLLPISKNWKPWMKHAERLVSSQTKELVTQHWPLTTLPWIVVSSKSFISGLSPDAEAISNSLSRWQSTSRKIRSPISTFEENASALANTLKEAGVKTDVNPLEVWQKRTPRQEENLHPYHGEKPQKTTNNGPEGPEIEPEKEGNTRTSSQWLLWGWNVKDRALVTMLVTGSRSIAFLEDRTFDQVFDYKAKLTGKMTKDEYKAYYRKGYQADVTKSTLQIILWNLFKVAKAEIHLQVCRQRKSWHIRRLNRGVRFLFEATDADAGRFKAHVQLVTTISFDQGRAFPHLLWRY